MIAAGYEDGNDATGLRRDPLFKLALEGCRRGGTCVRNRPSRGWRTCPMIPPIPLSGRTPTLAPDERKPSCRRWMASHGEC